MPDSYQMIIAKNSAKDGAKNSPLKEFRMASGKTQLDVASKLKVDTGRISDYENGRRWIKVESVGSVSDAFGCTPAEFLSLLYDTWIWSNR
jgi:transcriptional regulator with XRE-family HTH domain